MSTPITPQNCDTTDILTEYADHTNTEQKAVGWEIVFNFCKQNCMEKLPYPSSGIETVITFIDNLIKNK